MAVSRSDILRQAPPDENAPVVDWDDFRSYVLDWKQNQHLAAVGPTEQGKTNLVYQLLLDYRKYVAFLATKPKDAVLDQFARQGGYTRIPDWPPKQGLLVKKPVPAEKMPRRLVWPDASRLDADAVQKRVFKRTLDDVYVQGGWCAVFDDYWYLSNILDMEKTSKKMLMNARSNDIPFVLCAQRPAGNRLVEIFDQSTHLFFARDNDEANLRRIGGVGWLDAAEIRSFVAHLEPYQFLYVNTRTGWKYRTTAPRLELAT